jgi:hypothetical protein
MTTVFDRQFAASAFPGLLAQYGEPITYYPAAGGKRTLTAIVDRDPPAILDGSGNAVMPSATIRVQNSNRCGIWSKTVNVGTDEIEMPRRIGEAPTRMSLMVLMSQDSGVTQLAIK